MFVGLLTVGCSGGNKFGLYAHALTCTNPMVWSALSCGLFGFEQQCRRMDLQIVFQPQLVVIFFVILIVDHWKTGLLLIGHTWLFEGTLN